ncbi:hypothetical protein ACTFIU_005704 [Dictyostelium citrinum]
MIQSTEGDRESGDDDDKDKKNKSDQENENSCSQTSQHAVSWGKLRFMFNTSSHVSLRVMGVIKETLVIDNIDKATLVIHTKAVILGDSNEDRSLQEIRSQQGWAKQRLVEALSSVDVDTKSDTSCVITDFNDYVDNDLWQAV